jgi:hypothetical protein
MQNSNAAAIPPGPVEPIRVDGRTFSDTRIGKIARMVEPGFGIIVDFSDREYPFSFGAIEHYVGQSAATLASTFGLKVGGHVKFAIAHNLVVLVQPYTVTTSSSVATADTGS